MDVETCLVSFLVNSSGTRVRLLHILSDCRCVRTGKIMVHFVWLAESRIWRKLLRRLTEVLKRKYSRNVSGGESEPGPGSTAAAISRSISSCSPPSKGSYRAFKFVYCNKPSGNNSSSSGSGSNSTKKITSFPILQS